MKRKDFIDLRNKTIADLVKMVSEKKFEAKKAKMSILAGKEKNLKAYRNLRRDIAQILTLIKEKEILEKLQSKEQKGKEKA
jgi:ribosomal protein L29